MQISSVGSYSSNYLLSNRPYSSDTILRRLVQKKNEGQKLADSKNLATIKETLTTGVHTTKNPMDVLNNSLNSTNDDLHSILKIAQYATGNISDEDRKKCQEELQGYLDDINRNGNQYDEAVRENDKKEAGNSINQSITATVKKLENSQANHTQRIEEKQAELSVETDAHAISDSYIKSVSNAATISSPRNNIPSGQSAGYPAVSWTEPNGESWAKKLNISDLCVATQAEAKKAVAATQSAISKVENEIEDLAKKNYSRTADAAHSLSNDSGKPVIADSTTAAEYLNLLKAAMLADSTNAVVSHSKTGSMRTTTNDLDITA